MSRLDDLLESAIGPLEPMFSQQDLHRQAGGIRRRRWGRRAMLAMVAIAALVATSVAALGLSNGAPSVVTGQPAGGPCTVTKAAGRGTIPSRAVHSAFLGATPGTIFGRGDLWVLLPPNGHYHADRDPVGGFYMKIAWWRGVPGELRISARRLDGRGQARGDVPSGYSPTGFQPSGLLFSQLGCWRITGTLDHQVVRLVVKVT